MKICPRCQKTYADDNLNFCLEDGSELQATADQTMADTIVMDEPPRMAPTNPTPSQPGWQQQQQQNWQRPVSMQRPRNKSSKAWLWVLGILGILLLLCGGGFVGFIFWAAKRADKTANSIATVNKSSRTSSPMQTSTSPSLTSSPPSTSSRTDLTTVDLDMFTKAFSPFSTTELNSDELTVSSTMKDHYFELTAPIQDTDGDPMDDFKTNGTDMRVTVRNIENADSHFGYGLVFHSNPQPLQQDYAFLIDTKKKKYRVVRHQAEKEFDVIKWTSSTSINAAEEENILEARDQTEKVDLYINGMPVNSITNTYGYPGGVIGLYWGGAIKIGFKNLQLRR